MGHIGLEAERFWPADHLQKIDHVLPAVHAAPADLAFGRKALAMLLGDVAGLAESLRDRLLVRGGMGGPIMHAGRRIDAHDAGAVGCRCR